MTLVVSLRVPDGVVIAADSLQTTRGNIVQGVKDFKVIDPNTGREISVGDLEFPPIAIPTSTSSFAQKMFPFKRRFGIATFGSAIVNNRTIYNHIKNLEYRDKRNTTSVSEIADIIKNYFEEQVKEQIKIDNVELPEDGFIVGFQIAGYESENDIFGRTIEVTVGKESNVRCLDNIGCTVSGDTEVVRKLWELGEHAGTNYGSFSLKDAIDYAEFLINTTSKFQRFADMIPTVGGSVDVALITNYSDFTWIKYKELTKILEKI